MRLLQQTILHNLRNRLLTQLKHLSLPIRLLIRLIQPFQLFMLTHLNRPLHKPIQLRLEPHLPQLELQLLRFRSQSAQDDKSQDADINIDLAL